MKARLLCLVVSLGVMFSAGCTSLEPLLASLTPPSPVPTASAIATSTPLPVTTDTPPAKPESSSLRIWLPAQFDPAAESPAAELLSQRLAEFEAQHPELKIEVRLKSAEAEGDLLNALSITSAAALGALPDLILLSRSEMEAAATAGFIHPMNELSTLLDDPNWYSYAEQLGRIQTTAYGLPFMGDALVLVFYPELGQLLTWEDVLASEGHIVFPAADPQALIGLSLYASAGGEVVDAQGLPALDPATLTRVLSLVQEGLTKEIFPASLANVTTEGQTLQIYRSGQANKALVWFMSYRPSEDGAVTPLPGLRESPFSYATGWVWAVAGEDAEKQQLAVELAEFLVNEDFLAAWTHATGYLPTRPSIVRQGDRNLTAILESAHPLPSSDVLAVVGPLMQEALTRVLNGEQPDEVSASVVDKLR